MKILDGKVQTVCLHMQEDKLQKNLDKILKKWFNLEFKDFPEILSKIGIDTKNCEVEPDFEKDDSYFTVKVKSGDRQVKVEFFTGTMDSPHPLCKVYEESEKKPKGIYSLERVIQVEKIM